MPGISGLETLDALRSHPVTRRLPILFLSALGSSRHKIRGLRRGADDYLAKPFEGDELVLRIERLCQASRHSEPVVGDRAQLLERALETGDFDSRPIDIGRYRAVELIGSGGMGVVLRAWDPTLQRSVALKTLRLDRLGLGDLRITADSGAAFINQLIREGAALARFNHPNIVAVYDAGVDGEIGFVVMELMEGVSLLDLVGARQLTSGQVAQIGLAIVRALATAHAHDIIHRDVKPGNVLLSYDGAIKVTDFGLADTVESLAGEQRLFGTPGYLPPECLVGEPYDTGGDIFCLGVVLYRCITGRPAFSGDTLQALLAENLAAKPVPPRELRDGVPAALNDLVLNLMAPEPEQRPSTEAIEARLLELASSTAWDAGFLHGLERRRSSPASQSAQLIEAGTLAGALPASLV